MNKDEQHLNLLSVFHYIFGGLVALFACIPIIHLCVGVAMVCGAFDNLGQGQGQSPGPPPAAFGWFFIVIAGMMILFGWAHAICIIVAGRMLARRRYWTFCLIIAALECLSIPLGTVLGVFTIVVLNRPSVHSLFRRDEPPLPPVDVVAI